jgi:hypothetical protein
MQRRSTKPRRSPARAPGVKSPSARNYWSRGVTETSNALDLDKGVFQQRSPSRIAASLKRSAERSRRRKSAPFRSAMSMLNFYINRAGKHLSANRKALLERAKTQLRALFGRNPRPSSSRAEAPSHRATPRPKAKRRASRSSHPPKRKESRARRGARRSGRSLRAV